MGFRKVALLTEIFALTAMSSVGFSSWLAIYSPIISANGMVNVESISNQNDYMNINSMLFSEYNADGFYNDFVGGSEISKTATLYVEIEVDLDKCKDVFGSYTKLNFDFELSCLTTRIKLFALANSVTMIYDYFIDNGSVTENNPSTLNDLNGSTKESSISIACSTYTGSLFVHLYYKINLTDEYETFYSVVTATNPLEEINFDLKCYLEGGNS